MHTQSNSNDNSLSRHSQQQILCTVALPETKGSPVAADLLGRAAVTGAAEALGPARPVAAAARARGPGRGHGRRGQGAVVGEGAGGRRGRVQALLLRGAGQRVWRDALCELVC